MKHNKLVYVSILLLSTVSLGAQEQTKILSGIRSIMRSDTLIEDDGTKWAKESQGSLTENEKYNEQAEKEANKYIIKCGDSYYFKDITINVVTRTIYIYQLAPGIKWVGKFSDLPITDADRLNGVEYKATYKCFYKGPLRFAELEYAKKKEWSDWHDRESSLIVFDITWKKGVMNMAPRRESDGISRTTSYEKLTCAEISEAKKETILDTQPAVSNPAIPQSKPSVSTRTYTETELLGALKNADYIINGGENYTIRWTNAPNSTDREKILDYINRAGAALKSAAEMARSLSNNEAISVISRCEGYLNRDHADFNGGGGGKNGLRDARKILRAYLKGK